MNKKTVFFIFISLLSNSVMSSDLMVFSRISQPSWNVFMIEEAEKLLFNLEVDFQPRRYIYKDETIIYDHSSVAEFMTEESSDFLRNIENISGLSILKIKPEIALNQIGYQIKEISPKVSALESDYQSSTFDAEIEIDGLEVFANSLDINFVLPQMVSTEKIVALKVRMVEPVVEFTSGFVLPLKIKVKLIRKNDKFEVYFPPADMAPLGDAILDSMHFFNFEFEKLEISDVSLDIMGRRITVDQDKLKAMINEYKNDLKLILIEQIADIIKKDGVEAVLSMVNGEEFAATYWHNEEGAPEDIPYYLNFKNISSHGPEIVKILIDGDFCTRDNYDRYKEDCIYHKEIIPRLEAPDDDKFEKSLENINHLLKNNNFVVSLGEDYINNLLASLIENGLWDDLLEEKEIKLGPQGAFIKFDEKSKIAKCYIDILYEVEGIKQLLLGRNEVRFPVVLDLDLDIGYEQGVQEDLDFYNLEKGKYPHLIFTVKDVILEKNVLKYGISEYGLKSTVRKIGPIFRKVVIKKIRNELFEFDAESHGHTSSWVGVKLPSLMVPQLNKLRLEKMKIQGDGHGRLNFYINGNENLQIKSN